MTEVKLSEPSLTSEAAPEATPALNSSVPPAEELSAPVQLPVDTPTPTVTAPVDLPASPDVVTTPAVHEANTSAPPTTIVDTMPTTVEEPSAVETPAPAQETVPVENPAPVQDTVPATVEKPTPAEKQNALTEKFTDVEWKALKEFREQLPELFEKAYVDKEGVKPTTTTIWGVPIDAHKPAEDPRVSVVLLKFLRARNLNVKDASTMFLNTLRWRDEFDIEAAMKEEFPEEIFAGLGHVYKTDKEGRPVAYNIYGGTQDIKAAFSDVKRFMRWRVKLMEETVAHCDFVTVDQTVQIHDYAGVSMSSRDANSKQAASEATNIFSSHYPELLYKKYFINVPTIMAWIFWAFKAIIPSATFAKMSVVGSSTHEIKKTLVVVIDEKNLPKRYGGAAEGF